MNYTVPYPFTSGYRSVDGFGLDLQTRDPRWAASDGVVAAPGGGQLNATKLIAPRSRVTGVASPLDSVILPPAKPGMMWGVFNANPVNTLQVFPLVGERFFRQPPDQPVNVPAGSFARMMCFDWHVWVWFPMHTGVSPPPPPPPITAFCAATGGGQGAPGGGQQYEISGNAGIAWMDKTGGAPLNIISGFGLCLIPSGFMAVGSGTTFAHGATILTTNNGITWTLRVDGAVAPWTLAYGSWGEGNIQACLYANSTYMAGGEDENGRAHLETSTDTISWTPQTVGFSPAEGRINSLAFGAGVWVAVGFNSGTKAQVQFSTNNGVSWTTSATNFSALSPSIQLLGVTYGGGKFVAVGGTSGVTGNGFEIWTSPDGNTWTRQTSRPQRDGNDTLNCVAYNGTSRFLAGGAYAGASAGGAILSSPDGVTWTDQPGHHFGSSGRIQSLTWSGGDWVAGGITAAVPSGTKGEMEYSIDGGVTWASSTINTSFGVVDSVVCTMQTFSPPPPPPPPPPTPCQVANILDGLAITPTGAYSTRKLKAGYTGAALQVWRASDGHFLDIGFGTDCSLDQNALLTFCAGTNCNISIWYDQSGNGHDVSSFAGNSSQTPRVVTGGAIDSTMGGHIVANSMTPGPGSGNSLIANVVNFPSTTQGSIFAVGNAASGGTPLTVSWQNLPCLCGADSDFGGNGNMVGLGFAQTAAPPVSLVPSLVSFRLNGTFFAAMTDIHVETSYTYGTDSSFVMRWNTVDAPNVTKGYVSGGTPAVDSNTLANNGPSVNFVIAQGGNIARTKTFIGTIAEVITFGTELSVGDTNKLGANQSTYWGVPWTPITI